MKLQKIICTTSVALLLAASSTVFAQVREQGGDIADGEYFYGLSPGSMVSYYKDGNKGQVTFVCELDGKTVSGSLSPGKNFEGNGYAVLQKGKNGPYTWHLHNNGYSNGNIRVRILTGSEVFLQCYQI